LVSALQDWKAGASDFLRSASQCDGLTVESGGSGHALRERDDAGNGAGGIEELGFDPPPRVNESARYMPERAGLRRDFNTRELHGRRADAQDGGEEVQERMRRPGMTIRTRKRECLGNRLEAPLNTRRIVLAGMVSEPLVHPGTSADK